MIGSCAIRPGAHGTLMSTVKLRPAGEHWPAPRPRSAVVTQAQDTSPTQEEGFGIQS